MSIPFNKEGASSRVGGGLLERGLIEAFTVITNYCLDTHGAVAVQTGDCLY